MAGRHEGHVRVPALDGPQVIRKRAEARQDLLAPVATKDLEASLEEYFRQAVRRVLKGRLIKLAPLEKGTPDRLVFLPGGIMKLVELKTSRGRLAPAQKLWHSRVNDLGIHVDVLGGREQIDAWVQEQLHN